MTVRTAPRITGNGFLVDGYAIETFLVARVDNDGEPCEVCQTEGRTIDCTVYGLAGDRPASTTWTTPTLRTWSCVTSTNGTSTARRQRA